MTSTAEFSALLEKKAELEDQIKAEAKGVFANSSKEIFEEYGDIVGEFGWNQYTPYFNDGEPCEFGMGELFIYTPQEIEDPDVDINHWESEGVFGWHGNEKTAFKHRETGKIVSYVPYDYEARRSKDEDYDEVSNPNYDPRYDDAKEAVEALVRLIDEDTAESLFGDHCTVIVTPNGVETEYLEHD